MTVSSEVLSRSYIPGAAMLPEPLTGLQFLDPAHIVVTTPDGSLQVAGTNYVIAGDGRTGAATITTLHAYTAGLVLTATRDTPFLQEAKTEAFQPLPADSIERELDRRAMIERELDADREALAVRSLLVPDGDIAPPLPPLVDFGGKAIGVAADGSAFVPLTVGGEDSALRTDLASSLAGTLLLAWKAAGIGAVARTLYAKLTDGPISNHDFGTLQQAINTGWPKVDVRVDETIHAQIELHSNQSLRFAGGKIIVAADADIDEATEAVLFNDGGENISIFDPVIDASATSGVRGIKLVDVDRATIRGGRLTKCCLMLESSDNTIARMTRVHDTVVDMAGYLVGAVYISGIRDVVLSGVECFAGKEGVGIYNGAHNIDHIAVVSYAHSQDGFVILHGDWITYMACVGRANGQSGFCTQSLGQAGQFVDWIACTAELNAADGFDIHGRPGTASTGYNLVACIAKNNGPVNGGCGYYILSAPGTNLSACLAQTNQFQGLFLNTSDDVTAIGFRSISNATGIASGPACAGIWVADSDGAQIVAPISKNELGSTQEYGVAFGGTSVNGHVIAGDLINNSVASFLAPNNRVTGSAVTSPAGVFFKSLSANGLYDEECTVAPTHSRPRGSVCVLAGGGTVQNYYSQGGGTWAKYVPGQAAITPPTGGGTVDSQARTAIGAIITALVAMGGTV